MAVELSCARKHKNAEEEQLVEWRNGRVDQKKGKCNSRYGTYHIYMKCKNEQTNGRLSGFGSLGVVDAIHSTNFSLNKSCGNRRLKRLCVGLKANSGIYFLVYIRTSQLFSHSSWSFALTSYLFLPQHT